MCSLFAHMYLKFLNQAFSACQSSIQLIMLLLANNYTENVWSFDHTGSVTGWGRAFSFVH